MNMDVSGQLGMSSQQMARVDAWMKRWVDSGKLPGLSVLVSRRGRIAYESCYGKADIARDRDITPDTIVRIYSMTKPLTSASRS